MLKREIKTQSIFTIAALVISAVLVVSIHTSASTVFRAQERDKNDYFLPSADAIKLWSLGFDHLMADLYWLAFIQYTGEFDPRRGHEYRHAYDYVNLITNLDPYFLRPYWFGCWAIGYWQKRPDLADKIIKRGIQHNTDDWELPYLGGVNAYIFGSDAKQAAVYYRQAAKLSGAPPYLEEHARILESKAYPLVKRKKTLYRLHGDAKDSVAKAAYYEELVKTLIQLYYEAPTEKIRRQARFELEGLHEDVSRLLQAAPPPIIVNAKDSAKGSNDSSRIETSESPHPKPAIKETSNK